MNHNEELAQHYATTTLSVNGVVVSHSYTEFPNLNYAVVTLYNVPVPTESNHFFVYDHVHGYNVFIYFLKPEDANKEYLETVSYRIIF
jgi:hypothetical protein